LSNQERDVQRKHKVLRHAEKTGHAARTCATSASDDQASPAGSELTSCAAK
jgi:hypothetical protein